MHNLTLTLPRHTLDEQLALALAQRAHQPATGWLAHGPLLLESGWPAVHALVGRLQAGAPRRLSALGAWSRKPHGAVERAAPDGLALFYFASDDEDPPSGAVRSAHGLQGSLSATAVWDAWLARVAPEHRLATSAVVPNLAVLWLRADGLAVFVFRPGDSWRAIVGGPKYNPGVSLHRAWMPVSALHLPGAQMLRLLLDARPHSPHRPSRQVVAQGPGLVDAAARSAYPSPQIDDEPADVLEGRYSRQSGALGPAVLSSMQHSRFAMVGVGRIGSVLTHSLARMGCSLLVIEPDLMSPHSLDGDLPPLMEGRPKAEGMQHQLRGLLRPGAALDARVLPVASPAVGALLADCDMVICCVDNDAARLWANAWALAVLKPLLVVATDLHLHGAEADLRLLPPGAGCLACTGGFAELDQLLAQLALRGPAPTPADFRQQRRGSLRSWGTLTAHVGLRMVEQMYSGRIGQALFRRLSETEAGGLQVQDWTPPPGRSLRCPMCRRLLGAGLSAVQPSLLVALVRQLSPGSQGVQTIGATAS